jgi:amidase
MNLEKYCQYDGLGLAELIAKKEQTPKDLAELALHAVEQLDPQLNAVIEVFNDRVEGLDEDSLADGTFKGVPFFLKDLGAAEKGRTQESGSRLLKGFVAAEDSNATIKFRDSGLNIMGRTTCPEFGYTLTTESILTGKTRSPWNTERIAGGSSGGSAAIVAAGIVPMAHANDGGGSIRIPASCCGLVGLKASRGRISNGPHDNDITFFLASEGFVTRTVRDTAAMLDATHGPFPGEAFEIVRPERPYLSEVGAPTGKLRVALATQPWGPSIMDPEVETALESTARLCEHLGHEVTDASPSIDFHKFFQYFNDLWIMGVAPFLKAAAQVMNREISEQTVEAILLSSYKHSQGRAAEDFIAILYNLNEVSRQLGAFYQDYDLLLTPTLTIVPPHLGEYDLDHPEMNVFDFLEKAWSAVPYTPLNNYTGTPAISLPLCESRDGLPIGMHFMAPFGREDLLIRFASALEQETPWKDRLPKVHVSMDKSE